MTWSRVANMENSGGEYMTNTTLGADMISSGEADVANNGGVNMISSGEANRASSGKGNMYSQGARTMVSSSEVGMPNTISANNANMNSVDKVWEHIYV